MPGVDDREQIDGWHLGHWFFLEGSNRLPHPILKFICGSLKTSGARSDRESLFLVASKAHKVAPFLKISSSLGLIVGLQIGFNSHLALAAAGFGLLPFLRAVIFVLLFPGRGLSLHVGHF